MTIYTQQTGLNPGLIDTFSRAQTLLQTATPLSTRLMDGHARALVIEVYTNFQRKPWDDGIDQLKAGDGRVTLTRPGERSFDWPDPSCQHRDPRFGTPLWILHRRRSHVYPAVLGTGLYYPSTGAIWAWLFANRCPVCVAYFADTRMPPPKGAIAAMQQDLQEQGLALWPQPPKAPSYRGWLHDAYGANSYGPVGGNGTL